MHLANPNLPFGGVGMSGIGQYHGKYTFQTFSHSKSYIFRSTRLDSSVMYPPYKGKFKYIRTFLKLIKICKSHDILHCRGLVFYLNKLTCTPSGAICWLSVGVNLPVFVSLLKL